MTQTTASDSARLIKKYPNRRLYDTHTSAYITLVDIKQLVMASESFTVVDVKTNEDITRSILLQIILEEESANVPMFSASALEHIIRFYGSAMQGVMGTYLEKNIQAFIDIQDKMAEQSQDVYGRQMGPEAWAQFMSVQAPVMQSAMNMYMDQSQKLFMQMQDQVQGQAYNLFNAFPFVQKPKDKP
ncbi:polyhydroxyalkanoate synthesis repressor PhaR [Paenalcaligenes niemegkensis]|uniref:polyhydroxyalkanoate synthesis repressor PhaR n=1 Tax=Paenalcaligenes niemegkensis TaxID=2895469 RepID=UPI001EE95868|nr:polyhydroxyalkanoate synthesis repressor PhaR [Paenalcaligenes niemegkensis]MCQ9615656.1 polyhydroxyalkanoate synthesis repressor PhaR [Paenalcaligenes niemegkensis]